MDKITRKNTHTEDNINIDNNEIIENTEDIVTEASADIVEENEALIEDVEVKAEENNEAPDETSAPSDSEEAEVTPRREPKSRTGRKIEHKRKINISKLIRSIVIIHLLHKRRCIRCMRSNATKAEQSN